jgi:hypothetical protein
MPGRPFVLHDFEGGEIVFKCFDRAKFDELKARLETKKKPVEPSEQLNTSTCALGLVNDNGIYKIVVIDYDLETNKSSIKELITCSNEKKIADYEFKVAIARLVLK